jgi:hypothetical protein
LMKVVRVRPTGPSSRSATPSSSITTSVPISSAEVRWYFGMGGRSRRRGSSTATSIPRRTTRMTRRRARSTRATCVGRCGRCSRRFLSTFRSKEASRAALACPPKPRRLRE